MNSVDVPPEKGDLAMAKIGLPVESLPFIMVGEFFDKTRSLGRMVIDPPEDERWEDR